MTDEEAEVLRKQLEEHYDEPVMPISRYCNALRRWARCIRERDWDREKSGEKPLHGGYGKVLETVLMDIAKSNLLWRLLYCGQQFRTQQCPEHKGSWDGHAMLSGCSHQCDGTGWLREPGDPAFANGVGSSPVVLVRAVASEDNEED